MLPSFDNVLNQDIRHPRVAHVIEGVRCAMNSFLRTRQRQARDRIIEKEKLRREKGCVQGEWWELVPLKDGTIKGAKIGKCVKHNGYLALDDSRFALDPTQKAQVELILNATNTGGINYNKISNAVNLGPLNYFRANGSSSSPYPGLSVTAKGTNTVSLAISMDQKIPDEIEISRAVANVLAQEKPSAPLKARITNAQARIEPVFETNSPQTIVDEYNQVCVVEGDGSEDRVDYLAIKQLLIKLVEEQGNNIYEGAPEYSLNTLTLTTSFQLAVDASMGTLHLLRIVPVLVPPTAKFNPDHTHTLKITLKGGYKKNLPTSWADVELSCRQRLGRSARDTFCRTPQAQQRELLIEELQNSRAVAP